MPPSITLAPLSYNVTMNSAVILSCESTTGQNQILISSIVLTKFYQYFLLLIKDANFTLKTSSCSCWRNKKVPALLDISHCSPQVGDNSLIIVLYRLLPWYCHYHLFTLRQSTKTIYFKYSHFSPSAGFPPPTISWRKNGNLIIPKGGKFTAGRYNLQLFIQLWIACS